MKSRSSSPPILVHANESTPVRVHIQKPKLLPSVVEKGPTRRVSITLGGTENNSSVIHSSDASFDEKSNINKQVYRCGLQIDSLMEDLESLKNKLSGHLTNEQFEDGLSTSNWTTEECEAETQELNRTTDKIRTFKESFEKLQKELDLRGLEKEDLGEENMLLTALKEAEMASISTAEQVAALKNSTVELIQDARRGRPEVEDQKLEHRCRNQVAEVNQLSASGVGRFAGANNLLLEKLENFKIANQKLQYLLRDLWNPEPCVNCTNRQMGVLTQKLTRSETENIHLKRKLLDIERNAKEFSEQYQMEKDNSCFVKQLSKSVEATQVRLQEQLKNKDAKSNRMSIQIRKFEKTVIDQKLQIAHLRSQLPALKGKAEVDKEVLKKAARAQKRRAERFEAAMENLNSQIKDKDLKLSETRLTVDSWKKQHDLAVEEKAQLETEIISLSNRVADLKEQLQSSAERSRSTSHDLLSKLHNSNLENSNLRLENAQLKVSLTALEEKASTATAEIEQLKAEGKQQKEVVLQYETQAGDQSFQLKSSSEKVESLHEEKQKLQTALEALSRRLKEVDLQNQELTETMAKQEEALLHSRCQLEERSRESAALSRQLEAAIHDVSEKVSEVKDQAVAQECALQSKVHSLESELNRKTKELKQLQQNKNNAEMSHKTHLQELKLSLEQSESENQSIQNYVQFLKMSYAIMFGDSTLTEFHAEPSLR
ncbi:protein BCAP-like isoform X2 [Carcharodon carcharias]|uniref:protein BCAP-like isoform X2 n=1 Tax=Carcharodon carcharias TaxID=13397 RepID=UPI001B7E4E60|nr:protein BCAP-like isoform X2 [Carcharodon carcharias]